jgi:hypothetical protein
MSETLATDDWTYGIEDMNWVYGLRWGADPVFMPRQWAENVAAYAWAITDTTWGDVKQEVTSKTYANLLQRFIDDGEEPTPETPLSIDPFAGDMDILPWVNQHMDNWMPDEVIEKFGTYGISMVSGEGLFFDEGKVNEIVAELERLGYSCSEDQGLVNNVCGT